MIRYSEASVAAQGNAATDDRSATDHGQAAVTATVEPLANPPLVHGLSTLKSGPNKVIGIPRDIHLSVGTGRVDHGVNHGLPP